jgi:hypothetical protein
VADSASLVQERWTDDYSFSAGLVFDEMAGVFSFGTSGVKANLAESLVCGGGGGHCIVVLMVR